MSMHNTLVMCWHYQTEKGTLCDLVGCNNWLGLHEKIKNMTNFGE